MGAVEESVTTECRLTLSVRVWVNDVLEPTIKEAGPVPGPSSMTDDETRARHEQGIRSVLL